MNHTIAFFFFAFSCPENSAFSEKSAQFREIDINVDSSPAKSGHAALSVPEQCKDAALRLLFEKRLAVLSYENSRLNLKLNANHQ